MENQKKRKQASDLVEIFQKMKTLTFPKKEKRDLSVPEIHLLFIINNNKITPSQIAEKMNVTLPAITHLLNSLEKKDLIKRNLSKTDRRNFYINLTHKGKSKYKNLKKNRNLKFLKAVEYLGEKDTDTIIKLFKKLIERLKKEQNNQNK